MDLATILQDLNPAQQAAVTSASPVVQILAPPGSGKTKTLTSRVAYHLRYHGYQPANTICLTFTIKSAREMKERIARLIGDGLERRLVLGTFHSVCRRYLVTYGHLIGVKKGFGIADSADSLAVIKRIVKRLKATLQPNVVRSRISRSKARREGYEDLRREATAKKSLAAQQEFLQIFQEYEAYLATSNLLDYDDLLLRCVDLLQKHPECVSNVEAVLIDEFQDTNSVQFELMRLFAARHQRITTVGDPDQSIYGWRSAEIKNLTKMQRLYADTLVLNLEVNYRSSEAILAAAKEVIEQDTARPQKPLQALHCRGTFPVLRQLPSSQAEAAWISSEIRRYMTLTGGQLLTYSDFAILLRSASLSRQIESALGRAGMPYRMVGGARFFDRVEIKILLNYLRVIASPNNSEAFAAIINVPPRRIGDVTIKSLLEEARVKSVTLFALIRSMIQGTALTTKLNKPAEIAIGSLLNIILTARKKLSDEALFYPPEVLSFILQRLDYKEYLNKTYPEDIDARWANVEELAAQASDPAFGLLDQDMDEESLPTLNEVEQQNKSTAAEEALNKFLANVALSTELQADDEDDPDRPRHRITISTIHAAKGLEWPVVFIPSVYDGSIPHSRSEDTDEERRLLYVAMTRAQALLAVSRPLYNSTRGEETELSQFLSTKQVNDQFAQLGPSMRSEMVHQIAEILGRERPSEDLLNAGLVQAANLEDDLWTVDGEEVKQGLESEAAMMPLKRRKLDFTPPMSHNNALPQPIPAQFVSASTHLLSIKTQATLSSAAAAPTASPASRRNVKPQGQRTLQSLWCPSQPAAFDMQLPKPQYPQHITPTHSLGPNDSNPRSLGNMEIASLLNPIAAKENLAPSIKHRVQNTKFTRPTVDKEGHAPTYVFLSSSPPPGVAASNSNGAKHLSNPSAALVPPAPAPVPQPGFRPAATLHHTSMHQLHHQGAKNRSLGLRRNLPGVSTLGHGLKPFKPPRPMLNGGSGS